MKLVASMIAGQIELDRYIVPCIAHLLEFCDEVALLPDGDGLWTKALYGAWGAEGSRVTVLAQEPVDFYAHEGRARQRLLDFTLSLDPTHVLAVDCDEFVADGAAVRAACEHGTSPGAWYLCMQEVWNARGGGLDLRQDGGWVEHDVPILWAPAALPGPLVLPDRALACGRTPTALNHVERLHSCSAILHFGWANQAERAARYQRYVEHDGGRFHAKKHLDSIMYGDDRVQVVTRAWPAALEPYRAEILRRAAPSAPVG